MGDAAQPPVWDPHPVSPVWDPTPLGAGAVGLTPLLLPPGPYRTSPLGWQTPLASSQLWLRPTPSRPTCGSGSDGSEVPVAGQGLDTARPDVQPQVPAGLGQAVQGKGPQGLRQSWSGPGRGHHACAGGIGAPVPLRVETPQAVNAVFCCSNIKHACCLDGCSWKRNVWVPPLLLGTVAGCHPSMEPAGVWRAAQSTWSVKGQPLSVSTPCPSAHLSSPWGSPC